MELEEGAHHQRVNILGAVNEICQIILLSVGIQTSTKICFSIKSKGQSSQTGLNLFCLKVTCSESVPFIKLLEENCLPQLCQIICEMQTKEKESHLALQVVHESNYRLQKALLLWLETNKDTSSLAVNILSETVKEVDTVDHISTVLEIRAFVTVNNIIQSSKDVLDLLERIKFLNPKVQLSFSLYSLTSVEVDLCSTCSISCGTFDIYSGNDAFVGKCTSQFVCQTLKVKSSKQFEIKCQDKEVVCLTCISCFAPLCAAKSSTNNVNPESSCGGEQGSHGLIRIQMYGPGNLPYDMKIVTEKLTLTPESLLPWQSLGLQVKKSFSCSSYDLHCSARIAKKAAVPYWAAQSQHFSIILAFILNWKELKSEDTRTIFKQDHFQYLENQVLNKEMYSTFQKAAYTSLVDLLSQDKHETIALQQRQHSPKHQPADSELFNKMIPDVVKPLTDVFMRSTNVDFRSQVGTLCPTSSRASMSDFLEKSLWRMVHKPKDYCENALIPDQAIGTVGASQVDDWDISQDSLFSMQEDGTMSPDSLDLEWEGVPSTALVQHERTSSYIECPPDELIGASCSAYMQQNINDGDSFDGFQSNANLSRQLQLNFESFLSSEKELELWEHVGDSLTSFSADTNAAVISQQEKIGCQHFDSAIFSASPLECSLIQATSKPDANEKMPRKRSSECIDDTAVNDERYHISNGTNSKMSTLGDGKKQKFQNSDAFSSTNLSHCKWLDTQPGDYVSGQSEKEQLDQMENTFSSCWFDEEEIANWYAELDD